MGTSDPKALYSYPRFPLLVPPHHEQQLMWAPDAARLNGIHLMGGPGSGKSRVMGRLIAWLDFLRGMPQVILDPTGATIDNFLDTLLRLPAWYLAQAATWPQTKQQQLQQWLPRYMCRLWEQVIYIDMSNQAYVVPFPLYHRATEDESLFVTAQRFLDVIRRIDVALQDAPIEGFNALYKVGTYAGMLLTALGLQITEAEDLLRHPDRWQARFTKAQAAFPEVRPAVDFFQEFANKPELRTRRSEAFLTKLLPFIAEPGMAAMFGATTPGLDWSQVVAKRQTVLLDFRGEHTFELRRFKIIWCFLGLLTFIKQRGIAGRREPLGLMIDEITQMLGFRANEQAVMAADIEELVSVVSRNYGVWLTIAHQNLSQIEERVQNALMQIGTQVIGVIPNPDDALYLARRFLTFDPYQVKKMEAQWMSLPTSVVARMQPSRFENRNEWARAALSDVPMPIVIDYRTKEFTSEEQFLLLANKIQGLSRFAFWVRTAEQEGNIAGTLQKMNIAKLDPGQFPDDALLAHIRQRLMKAAGTPITTILAEIDSRRRGAPALAKPQTKPARATLTTRSMHVQAETGRDLPTPTKSEDFWR